MVRAQPRIDMKGERNMPWESGTTWRVCRVWKVEA